MSLSRNNRKIRGIITHTQDKIEVAIFLSAFLVEIALGLYLVSKWGFTFSHYDAIYHTYIARTVLDGGNIANLGTRWPIMFRLSLVPLVWIDLLYVTGFAGTIVNALMTGGICVILFRLIGNRKLGILASALYMSNSFTLMYGATPMMEQMAIFFTVLAVYYFKHFWETGSLTEFMKCSLALIFGTLTRYEVWAVAALVALFFTLRELKNGKIYRLAYASLPLWGIFAWLFWNLAIWRDPLIFLRLNPWATHWVSPPSFTQLISHVCQQVFIISGMLSIIAISSIVVLLIHKKAPQVVAIILMLSPLFFLFSIFSLGYLDLSLDETRYYYLSFPGLVATPFMLLSSLKKLSNKRMLIAFTLLTLSLVIAYPLQISSVNFLMPTKFTEEREEMMAIKGIVGDQPVLMLSWAGGSHLYSLFTNTPPHLIVDEYDGSYYIQVMDEPWRHVPFVAIHKSSPDNPGIKMINDYYQGKFFIYRYYNDDVWRFVFLAHYNLVLETSHFLLYQRVA